MDTNVDYKEMYLTMVRAAEKAIRLLQEAQIKCEEQYLAQSQDESALPPIIELPKP